MSLSYSPTMTDTVTETMVSDTEIKREVAVKDIAERQAEDLQDERIQKELSLEKAGPMRTLKANMNHLHKVLATYDLSDSNRRDIKEKIATLKEKLNGVGVEKIEDEAKTAHLAFLASDKELTKVIHMWWLAMLPFLDEEQNLSKNGYETLQLAFQFALQGNFNEEVALEYTEDQYEKDIVYYGTSFTEEVFYNMLYEIATTWLEVFTTNAYTIFLWALFESIFDTQQFPFQVRQKRFITCVTLISEGKMYQNWFCNRDRIAKTLRFGLQVVRERKDHQEAGVIDVRKGSEESEESVEASDSPNGDQSGETIGDNNLLLNFERSVDHSAHSFLDGAGVGTGAMGPRSRRGLRKQGATFNEEDSKMVNFLVYKDNMQKRREERLSEQARLDEEERARREAARLLAMDNEVDCMTGYFDENLNDSIGGASTKHAFDLAQAVGQKKLLSKGMPWTMALQGNRTGWLFAGSDFGIIQYDQEIKNKQKFIAPRDAIISMNKYRQVNKHGRNWIGELKGNIFFGRGKYNILHRHRHLQHTDDSSKMLNSLSWNDFLILWMNQRGIHDDSFITYQMIADARAEYLNKISDENMRTVATPGGRVDGISMGLQPRFDGQQPEASSDHFLISESSRSHSAKTRVRLGSIYPQGITGVERRPEGIRASVDEVMDLIKTMKPPRKHVSIPVTREGMDELSPLKNTVLTSRGELGKVMKPPETLRDLAGEYSTGYQYHSPIHTQTRLQNQKRRGRVQNTNTGNVAAGKSYFRDTVPLAGQSDRVLRDLFGSQGSFGQPVSTALLRQTNKGPLIEEPQRALGTIIKYSDSSLETMHVGAAHPIPGTATETVASRTSRDGPSFPPSSPNLAPRPISSPTARNIESSPINRGNGDKFHQNVTMTDSLSSTVGDNNAAVADLDDAVFDNDDGGLSELVDKMIEDVPSARMPPESNSDIQPLSNLLTTSLPSVEQQQIKTTESIENAVDKINISDSTKSMKVDKASHGGGSLLGESTIPTMSRVESNSWSGTLDKDSSVSEYHDPRVEILAAEILQQRNKMLSAERLLKPRKKEISPTTKRASPGKSGPMTIPPLSVNLRNVETDSLCSNSTSGHYSRRMYPSDQSKSLPGDTRHDRGNDSYSVGSLDSGSLASSTNFSFNHNRVLQNGIETVKNQSYEDALMEQIFIGKGPSTFVGPANHTKRWKGASRVKYAYEKKIT